MTATLFPILHLGIESRHIRTIVSGECGARVFLLTIWGRKKKRKHPAFVRNQSVPRLGQLHGEKREGQVLAVNFTQGLARN